MRGQVTGRDLDDVGDAVLTYAEVKALATGNPLVIEQAGIQAELAKLERLARAHHDEQRRLERTAVAARVEATRRSADAARYDAALERRVDTSGDRFTMELDGRRYTKRVDAGSALTHHVRHALATLAGDHGARHELPARTIGHLGSFPIRLDGCRLSLTTEVQLTVAVDHAGGGPSLRLCSDDLDEKRPDRLITQLEGRLRRLDAERDRASVDADAHERRSTEAEARTGHPFPDQPRLDQLRLRYRRIVEILNADSQDLETPACRGTAASRPPKPSVAERLDAAALD